MLDLKREKSYYYSCTKRERVFAMLFNSAVFLWRFLPLCLGLYYLAVPRARNAVLLGMSLVFYAWGGPRYLLLLLVSILWNWLGGLALDAAAPRFRRAVLAAGVAGNLGLLFYFKYFTFLSRSLRAAVGGGWVVRDVVLPIGISFYTFQALSYLIDLYRGRIQVQKNLISLALYISLFPQLVAGPIVRYADVETQMQTRTVDVRGFAYGAKRFIYGLAKKVLCANTLAAAADLAFEADPTTLSTGAAWLAAVLYALQIYFDFSGYSDMAIGLGRMFGFHFPENFNYPYLARSVQEFWRRWHITLSTWFREYVYIPLGGNRRGPMRTYLNLLIVFFLTGLWHGANWTFICWGLWHGAFMLAERAGLKKLLVHRRAAPLAHAYTLLVCLLGWVLFRADTLGRAGTMFVRMFSFCGGTLTAGTLLNGRVLCALIFSAALCGPVQQLVPRLTARVRSEVCTAGENVCLAVLLLLCLACVAAGAYDAFIYFQF